jgi:hypothetical protein
LEKKKKKKKKKKSQIYLVSIDAIALRLMTSCCTHIANRSCFPRGCGSTRRTAGFYAQ